MQLHASYYAGVDLVFDSPNGYSVAEAQGSLTICLGVEGSQVMSEFQATLSFTEISAGIIN